MKFFHIVPNEVICCGRNEGLNPCSNQFTERTCDNRNRQFPLVPYPCEENPCDCIEGFRRNACGECVREDLCDAPCDMRPIRCKGQNEELIGCFDPSQARVCRVDWEEPSCPSKTPFPIKFDEKFSWTVASSRDKCILNVCDCKAGFSRNRCGLCVPDNECDNPCKVKRRDKCSDPKEKRYLRLRECDAHSCSNLKLRKHNETKEWQETDVVFRAQCDCKNGFFRDDCGRCVPEHECDDQRPCQCTNPCKKGHEEWRCVNTCTERTCANSYVPKACFVNFCTFKCDCRNGLARNKDGKCVLEIKCTRTDIKTTSKLVKATDFQSEAKWRNSIVFAFLSKINVYQVFDIQIQVFFSSLQAILKTTPFTSNVDKMERWLFPTHVDMVRMFETRSNQLCANSMWTKPK